MEIEQAQQAAVETPQAPADTDNLPLREYRRERDEERNQASEPSAGENVDQPKSKGGFQRRIDKLWKEKSELERRLAEREGQRTPNTESAAPKYEDAEAYTARVIREAREREQRSASRQEQPRVQGSPEEQQRSQEEYQAQHYASMASLRDRLNTTMAADPEFSTALKSAHDQVPTIIVPTMVNLPNGHDIAVFLAKNSDIRRRLTTMFHAAGDAVYQATSDTNAAERAANAAVIREVHRLSSALEYGTTSAPMPRMERPVSQAPAPITPVRGGDAPSVDDDKMSLSQYRKSRGK